MPATGRPCRHRAAQGRCHRCPTRAGPALLRSAAAGRARTPLPVPRPGQAAPAAGHAALAGTAADHRRRWHRHHSRLAAGDRRRTRTGRHPGRPGHPRCARAQARAVRAPARRRARQRDRVRRHRLPQRDHGHRHGRHDPGLHPCARALHPCRRRLPAVLAGTERRYRTRAPARIAAGLGERPALRTRRPRAGQRQRQPGHLGVRPVVHPQGHPQLRRKQRNAAGGPVDDPH